MSEAIAQAEQLATDEPGRLATGVPRLEQLCRTFILEREADLPVPVATYLQAAPYEVDQLYAACGRGRRVAAEFIGEIALQNAVPDTATGQPEDEDRVAVSTVHRSKGLEWTDVYSPYLNEGLMCVAAV